MQFVFIHGGPGLNSEPERNLIKKDIENRGASIDFWNEPKNLTQENPVRELVDDIKKFIQKYDHPVHLIGHSFGNKLILETLNEIKDQVASICLVSPSTDMLAGEKNVFNMAYQILSEQQPELATQLKRLIPKLTDQVDENRIEALKLALESGYIINYFEKQENFETYFSYFQGEHSINIDHFFKIRPFITQELPDLSDFKGKSMAIFGGADPAFKMENELKIIQKSLPDIQVEVIENTRHYPHIEGKEQFMKLLFEFI